MAKQRKKQGSGSTPPTPHGSGEAFSRVLIDKAQETTFCATEWKYRVPNR